MQDQGIYIFEEKRMSIEDSIGDVYCQKRGNEKCVYNWTNQNSENSFYDCRNCKTICQVPNVLFREQKATMSLFSVDATYCFSRKTTHDYEVEKPSPLLQKYFRQTKSNSPDPGLKKTRTTPFMA